MDKPSSVKSQANGNDLIAQKRRWLNHIQQCQNSGMSMAAYARSQGIQEKTFYYMAIYLPQVVEFKLWVNSANKL